MPDEELGIDLLIEDVIRPGWLAAAEAAGTVGARGETTVWIELLGDLRLFHEQAVEMLGHSTFIPFWTPDVVPTESDVQAVKREILRSAGFEVWEPPLTD